MNELPDGISIGVEYSTDLFDEASIERMIGHLRTLLEGAVADPDARFARDFLLSCWRATSPLPSRRCEDGPRPTGRVPTQDRAGPATAGGRPSARTAAGAASVNTFDCVNAELAQAINASSINRMITWRLINLVWLKIEK